MDGQLEFLNLDEELEVAIPEDGKAYLKQLGLEEYKWDQFTSGDPGLYWQDVPLENNPEAYLDVLSRESQRRRSTKSVSSTSSVAPDFSKAPGQAWKQRSSRHDGKKPNRTKPGAIPQQNQNGTNHHEQGGSKGLSKQVSFKERLAEEIPQNKGDHNTSTPKERHREQRRSSRDHETSNKGKSKDQRDKSGSRSSSKERNRSSSREKSKSGKSRKESLERDPKGDKTDGSNSPKKAKKFKMPDFKNLLPGKKKDDKQKPSVINAYDSKSGHTVIASDDDTDREGRSLSCLSTGRSSKHKYHVHEPSSTDVTSDESDFFRNSPNTVDLLTVCIDNEIPAHRYSSRQSTKLKRTSSLLSAVDGQRARSVHGGQVQGQKRDSVTSVTSVAPPMTSITNRGQNIIEIVSNEKEGGDLPLGTNPDRPENKLQGPLKFAYEGNLQKLKQHSANMSNDNVFNLRDEHGNTMLHLSAARGNLDCTGYLCNRWHPLLLAENKAKLTPAASAIKEGQIECLDWFLDNLGMDEDVMSPRRTLLHWAAKFGQDGCLRLLLSRLDSRGHMDHTSLLDQHLNSPAHMAAKYGHLTCLQTLVEFGVDVCSTNQYGHTPCYYADFGNHRHCAGYLMLVETVTHITKDLVDSKHRQARLQEQTEALHGHVNECMELSQWWLDEHQDHEMENAQTQQLLEELAEAASDLSGKLEDVLLENCTLRQKINGAVQNAPLFRDDVKESLDHAASLCQQLDNLNIPHDHQVARQYILKVKDIQRKIDLTSNRFESRSPPLDAQTQAALLMRQRIHEASQRLVVYRTSRDGKTPRRLDPGLMSPDGSLTTNHVSMETIVTHVPLRPHAARSLFGNSEPNLQVKMSASAMPLPSIPVTASASHTTNSTGPGPVTSGSLGHASSLSSVSSLSNGSARSNMFRPPGGNTAFREVGAWRSEPQINQQSPPGAATQRHSHSSSFLNNMVSGKPIVSGVQKSQPGSAFVPIVPTKPAENNNNNNTPNQSPDRRPGVRTMTSRSTGIHIHSSMPLNAISDSRVESSVDPDTSATDPFNDPDKTPTASPLPSRSYKSISSAISEVRRNIEEISKTRKMSSEGLDMRRETDEKRDPDVNDTPMLSALEDSSSNHSGDPVPYTAEIPDPVLDESLVTKGGTPKHMGGKPSKTELEFQKDFADKDMRTSSPVVGHTDAQSDGNLGRLTRENLKRNENLYWSTQKHDFTDSFILENEETKNKSPSPKRQPKKYSPLHENIFAGFAPPMPETLTDTREIPTQVGLSMQDFRDGYETGLLGDLEGPTLDDDDFDPYGLEPYQGANGLYFDHSLSTIEEVSVISESTRADEDIQRDIPDSSQENPNKTKESDNSTVIDSDEDSPRVQRHVESGAPNNIPLDESRHQAAEGNKAWYEDSDEDDTLPVASSGVGTGGWDTTGGSTLDMESPPSHPPSPPPAPSQPVTKETITTHFTIF